MRTSRLIRLIMRIFLLLLASSMSFVSFLGGYSALLILGDEDNIDLDVKIDGDPFRDPANSEIKIEFELYNMGYFDLEDLEIELKLVLKYWSNKTGTSVETKVKLYDDEKSFSTIKAGHKKKNSITIESKDLITLNFTGIYSNLDWTKDPLIKLVAEKVLISARYSLGLIKLKIEIEDYTIDKIEKEDLV